MRLLKRVAIPFFALFLVNLSISQATYACRLFRAPSIETRELPLDGNMFEGGDALLRELSQILQVWVEPHDVSEIMAPIWQGVYDNFNNPSQTLFTNISKRRKLNTLQNRLKGSQLPSQLHLPFLNAVRTVFNSTHNWISRQTLLDHIQELETIVRQETEKSRFARDSFEIVIARQKDHEMFRVEILGVQFGISKQQNPRTPRLHGISHIEATILNAKNAGPTLSRMALGKLMRSVRDQGFGSLVFVISEDSPIQNRLASLGFTRLDILDPDYRFGDTNEMRDSNPYGTTTFEEYGPEPEDPLESPYARSLRDSWPWKEADPYGGRHSFDHPGWQIVKSEFGLDEFLTGGTHPDRTYAIQFYTVLE